MGAVADLRTYLVTQQSYAGTVKIGSLPETPDTCVALIAYGGSSPVLAMGQHNVVERIISVQVLIRGVKDGYAAAETQAEVLWQLCRHALNVTVGSNVYDRVVAVNEPAQVVPDTNERPIFAFAVELWKRGS